MKTISPIRIFRPFLELSDAQLNRLILELERPVSYRVPSLDWQRLIDESHRELAADLRLEQAQRN